MKRIYLFLILTVSAFLSATAQNANRSGFFFEAGMGGTFGKTPMVSATYGQNYDFSINFAKGGMWNFGFGQRIKTSTHFAYEIKVNAQSAFKDILPAGLLKVYPLGLRYTSIELWDNMSLYATASAGMSFGIKPNEIDGIPISYEDGRYIYDSSKCFFTPGDTYKFKTSGKSSSGVAYAVGVGINVTTHFSAGLVLDGQYMLLSPNRIGRYSYNWGTIGGNIAYRF